MPESLDYLLSLVSYEGLALLISPRFHTIKLINVFVCVCSAPGAPLLIPEECSAENNSVTVAWQAPQGSGPGQRGPAIEGYLLELDDGCGGEFRVSFTFSQIYYFLRNSDESERIKLNNTLSLLLFFNKFIV